MKIQEKDYPNLVEVIHRLGQYVVDSYEDKLKSGDNIATGNLKAGVDYTIKLNDQNGIELYFQAPDKYWDKNTKKLYLEQGRLAKGKNAPLGKNFVAAIKKWIEDKKIISNKKGLEYAIAKKINREGITARPYLAQIKNDIELRFLDDIRKAFNKDIKRMVEKQIIIKVK